MTDSIFSEKPGKNAGKTEPKLGAIGRGKSAIMALLSMIEGSRERDAKTWIRIFETVADFRYDENSELEEKELVVLDVILHSLLPKVPVHFRRKFSDGLSRREEVSDILTESLVTDEFTVAAPLLARSKFLTEEHFKAAILRGSSQHRCVIAGRRELMPGAVDALLETGDVAALSRMLRNENIILSEKSFLRLLSHYLGHQGRERKVLEGPHLTMPLAYQSYWRWSPASKVELLRRFPMTTETFGEILDRMTQMRGDGNAAGQALNLAVALHDRLLAVSRDGYTLILDQTNIDDLVEFMLNGLCLGKNSVRRILTDTSGLSLAIFCNAIGLGAAQFEEVFSRLFQREMDWEQYANNLDVACRTFKDIDSTSAACIVTVWCFGDVRAAKQIRKEEAA